MTSPGTWRVRTSMCAYLLITSTIIAAAATFSMTAGESAVLVAAAEQPPTHKIGPGLTRMPPIDFGKPERVVSITPYVSRVPSAAVQRPKRDVPRAAPPVASLAASSTIVNKPLIIVTVAQPEYRAPDIHRVY